MNIKISTLDLSFQTRFGLSDETVAEYAELMKDGTVFPPVDVYDISGVLSLVDGYHRIAAVIRNGGDEIDANVIPGTRADALRAAVRANCEHGQRRSNADKRRALEVAWENRDILFDKMLGENENHMRNNLPSSRQLAAITGVSIFLAHDFIEKRGVLESNTPAPEDDATKVTSAHLEERNADVRALLKKQKDRFGTAIPEKLLHAFLSTEPKKVAKQLKALRKMSEQRIFSGDLAFVGLGQQFLINLDNAIRNLKFWTPFCVCRGCRGEGCYRCSNHGFQSRSQYDMNPAELKAEEDR